MKALPEWLEKTPKDRMELLLKLADVIDENADELAKLESLNVGKPMSIAVDEMPFSADNLRFFAGAARTLEEERGRVRRGLHVADPPRAARPRRRDHALELPADDGRLEAGPALAAGNVQILKPAEQTPLTTLRFAELAQEFLPPGVLQVVTGDGVPVGDRLVRHPDVRLVSLTGDVATGCGERGR